MNNRGSIKGWVLIWVLLSAAVYSSGQEPEKDSELGTVGGIRIIQQASPESANVFGFSTTGTGLSNFTLVDDGVDNDATPNNILFSNLLSTPGQSASFSVTQTSNGAYDLTNISCSVSGTGGSTTSANLPLAQVNITLFFGDLVTCTFFDTVVVAAPVALSGRTVTVDGRPISRATVTVTEVASGEVWTAISSPLGYYTVQGMTAGSLCFVTVTHKRYAFESHIFSMQDNLEGFDLVGF